MQTAFLPQNLLLLVVALCDLSLALVMPERPQAAAAATQPAIAPAARPYVAGEIRLCQALCGPQGRVSPGVDSAWNGAQGPCGELNWDMMRPIPWDQFGPGEYVGMARTAHVHLYRLRVDDQMEFVYRLTREVLNGPYELNIGDEIRMESFTDERLNRDLLIQPDGTITLRLLGQVPAMGRTVQQLRELIEEEYKKYYKVPAITITPLRVNTKLEDLRATVDARAGQGGQRILVRVTPEGTVQLPAIGSVFVQGLSLDEVKREVDERYLAEIQGIEVTPVLTERAPRYVYVIGEVAVPGRYSLEGPTTVMQALAMAGSWNIGANTRQIVIFRRADDWRLMATILDLQGALLGKRPSPADEIWLNDSDIVIVPKSPFKIANDFLEQTFTRGIYAVAPFQGFTINLLKGSTL